MTKALFTTTAVLEAATGLVLLVSPSTPVSTVLGAPLGSPIALVIARIAGAALLAFGVMCWVARADPQSRTARGVLGAMFLYYIAVVAILVHARLGAGLTGIGLWPAAMLHTALTVWCVGSLRARPGIPEK